MWAAPPSRFSSMAWSRASPHGSRPTPLPRCRAARRRSRWDIAPTRGITGYRATTASSRCGWGASPTTSPWPIPSDSRRDFSIEAKGRFTAPSIASRTYTICGAATRGRSQGEPASLTLPSTPRTGCTPPPRARRPLLPTATRTASPRVAQRVRRPTDRSSCARGPILFASTCGVRTSSSTGLDVGPPTTGKTPCGWTGP